MEKLCRNLAENITALDQLLDRKNIPQIKLTRFQAGGKECCFYFMDGLVDHYRLVLLQSTGMEQKVLDEENMDSFAKRVFSSSDHQCESHIPSLIKAILKGATVLLAEGYDSAMIVDAKKPPARSIQEPDKSKTLRGSHEGFCENIILNLALIRRRIRSNKLKMIPHELGDDTKTDVSILYLQGKADEKTVEKINTRLQSINTKAVSMAQESIAEYLFAGLGRKLNPYPKLRFTERPDTAAAMLLEGKILILCDNSPSAIVLPVSLFDFFEETDDYYFPVLTGTYMRLIRFFVFLATVYLAPLWLLATQNAERLPSLFHFVGKLEDGYSLPIYLQLLVIEFAIDGLKLASLNTPSTLSNSLSVVGGLLLGDYAVKSGWFLPQSILYSAFTAMANFVPSNLELGYCFKFQRIALILLTHFCGLWGLISGSAFFLLLLAFTKTLDGKSYLYPLFPFDGKALLKIFFRSSHGREQ